MMLPLRALVLSILVMGFAGNLVAQCTDYDIIVGGGTAQGQVHWELMDGLGNIVASGDAPETTGQCLDDGGYTMVMYDDGNNGWQGTTWSINYENTSIVVASGTLASGGYGTAQVDLNGNCGSTGCTDHLIDITAGSSPNDVYWELVDEFGVLVASGGAPESFVVCLADGCYTLYLYDSGGDGWEGGFYTITDLSSSTVVGTGTLPSGSYGTAQVIIGTGCGSCAFYDLEVTAGSLPGEISWDLYDDLGNFIAAGGAPTLQSLCLAAGCYTLYAYDAGDDGWNGAGFTVSEQASGNVLSSGTLINAGFGSFQISIGGGCGITTCTDYSIVVSAGGAPSEISWSFSNMGVTYGSGWAPTTEPMCLDTGCFVMYMYDSGNNGWNGATWTLQDALGATVQSGTLASGSSGAVAVAIGSSSPCDVPTVVTASDCPQAVNVCTNLNFTINPNGWGNIWEIPVLGSTSNPQFLWGDGSLSPWGTDHYGCLMGQEINTTWMIVNIAVGGSLEFTLGANGAQAGFYDWTMFPYSAATCGQILANTIAPVRCNWNYASSGGTGLASTIPAGGFPENYEPPLNVLSGQRYLICFSNWSSVTTVVPLVFGGTAVVSCTPLPIELLAFDARVVGSDVEVRWITGSEVNTDHFEVERTADQDHWETVGQLAAAGTSNVPRTYAFTDWQPIDDASYYRLRSVDQDGSTTLSRTIMVNLLADALVCHPNPTTGATLIDHVDEGTTIEVFDMLGRPLTLVVSSPQAGVRRIDLQGYPPGLYSIRATGANGMRTAKVMRTDE
ncbi:MAG: T9SS type A sorting domain-containing protein [Flavobacteriales bacterium]|nr:T9SS type A sorting domain-containing protein [Flavobacteriales bacterium]